MILVRKSKETAHMEDTIGLDERIILKSTLKNSMGVDWIGVAQDREKPGAVVSTEMSFGLHKVQVTS
jgi:hypothetical protein